MFFDNLSVQHKQGPLLEENHYYPFGLTMEGLSDKAIKTNYAENKYRYNSGSELQNKEFSDGTGWEMYETQYRGFDPQIRRFGQIDPMADESNFSSTYEYAGDNPIIFNDPFGSEKSYASDWNNILSQCEDMLTILQATDNAGADFTLDDPNSGSDEGSFTFESDAQAFEAGADNMDEFRAWGKTVLRIHLRCTINL